ncbi:MAG: NERD domain-containing protein, partial [Tepidisphaeraceae bacterium]
QGGDIDHVFVEPRRLYLISTKTHRRHVTRTASGSARLNGQPMDEMYDEAMRLALWTRDRLKTVLGDQVPWVQPVLCLPHVHSDLPPTEGKVWLLNDQTLLETLEPEKPKSKIAAKRVELVAGELAKITC